MGKYGQFYGQVSITNNFTKLFICQAIVEAYRVTLLYKNSFIRIIVRRNFLTFIWCHHSR
jgi:hypothetical protein